MSGVRVTGLKETIRAMQRAGVTTEELKGAWAPIGAKVVQSAKAVAPSRTGRMSGSIRASKRKSGVIVSAGGARAPYTRYVYYGSTHNSPPNPFLVRALERVNVEPMVARAVDQALRSAGL